MQAVFYKKLNQSEIGTVEFQIIPFPQIKYRTSI